MPDIANFLATGSAVDPTTVIDGIQAVRAGEMLLVRDGQVEHSHFWRPNWRVRDVPWHEAVEGFRERLDAAVESHLISDVPTSVFLSGGLDSSVITALAVRQSPNIKSFSVAFAEQSYSEGHFSRLVARHFGTEHHEVMMGSTDLAGMLTEAFAAMDQPTFDGVNTYAVAAAARQAGLNVSLSGLGADELLDGYGMARRVRMLTAAGRVPSLVRPHLPLRILDPSGARAGKLRTWLVHPGSVEDAHTLLRSLFLPAEVAWLVPGVDAVNGFNGGSSIKDRESPTDTAWLEMSRYMRNVLLRDSDCMSMANSVELRAPLSRQSAR